ncbi:MAG TPA: Hsp20/alpha crystallin family protein [Pirellula sp.]|nr:Hsp20/alpha crystallin family protein [Pirellula sp.]
MVHFRFPIRQLPVALQDFATDMETIVDQVFNQGDCKGEKCESTVANGVFRPAIDIYESELQFDLFVDLPGVKADAVRLEMEKDRLVVSGNRIAASVGEGTSAHRVERLSGDFSRSIQVPKQLDAEKIEAHFDNGVLHVVLPKQSKPTPRTIQIKTN